MAPPGYAADVLRSAYRSWSYIPSLGRWIRIRWYFLPAGTPLVRGEYLYTSPIWDYTTDFWPGYGESGVNPISWVNGSPPPWTSVFHARLSLAPVGVVTRIRAVRGATLLVLSQPEAAPVTSLTLISAGLAYAQRFERSTVCLALSDVGTRRLRYHADSHATLALGDVGRRRLVAHLAGLADLALIDASTRRMLSHRAGLAALKLISSGAANTHLPRAGLGVLKLISAGTASQYTTYDRGFDFRSSLSTITDPSHCFLTLASDLYPTTANGATYGWIVTNTQGANRSTTLDPRLCGIVRNTANNSATFRVDLPMAGNYDITLAWGDNAAGSTGSTVSFFDNATLLAAYGPTNLTIAHFRDANATDWTAANWPANNTKLTVNMTSTIFKMTLAAMPISGNSPVAHLRITKVP